MFNEYLDHSNQCGNYYTVVRKEEINLQQNETNRFKQKWIEVSGYNSSSNVNVNVPSLADKVVKPPPLQQQQLFNSNNSNLKHELINSSVNSSAASSSSSSSSPSPSTQQQYQYLNSHPQQQQQQHTHYTQGYNMQANTYASNLNNKNGANSSQHFYDQNSTNNSITTTATTTPAPSSNQAASMQHQQKYFDVSV